MLSCPIKAQLGIDCMGCGMQRALLELLRGNLLASIRLYPGLLPLMLSYLITIAHVIGKFRHGASAAKWSFLTAVAIVVVSYILKLATLTAHDPPMGMPH